MHRDISGGTSIDRWKQQWTPLLPERVSEVLDRIDDDAALLEIRLRRDRPLELVFDGGDRIVYGNNKAPIVTEEELRALCARLMEYSAYAWENERKNGFITVGGCRVGLSGRMLRTSDGAAGFSSVSGICIRIVREVKGCAGPLIPQLLSDGRFCSVLVVSPPGCGKTTMLRDLIRIASDVLCGAPYCRVGVADERFELCGDAIVAQGADAETLADAQRSKLDLVNAMETELTVENLVRAKGFSDVIVSIHQGNVNVVVGADSLSDEQVAQILDIVLRETGKSAENVKISTTL